MKFVDSHAHYNDLRFEEEFPGGADAAIFASHDAGAAYILNAGTNMQTSLESIALSQKFPFVFAAAGIHPYDCAFIEESVDSAIAEIEPLLSDPAVRAIGEIGLDYHYDGIDREKQKEYFIAQLELARTTGMPVVIHDRGSAEAARQLSSDGRYISFSGTVTYKNARNIHEAAAVVPDDLILCETDAPYLPPVPHRGKINSSAYLPHTISAIAEIREASPEAVAELTMNNAVRLFGFDR